MVYYVFRICSSKGAWELKPKKDLKLDLSEVARRFRKVDFRTDSLISVESYGKKVSIYPTGKVLVFDVESEKKGRMIASRVFGMITGKADREARKALFVGRFQPFHKGHLKAVEGIAKRFDMIVIVIGGPAGDEPTLKDPFTFDEREKMMRKALEGRKVDFELHMIRDVEDDEKWAEEISKLGNFEAAYTRNPWTARCLKTLKIPVRKQKNYQRYKHCGTRIRKRILQGKDWKSLIPREVYEYIREIRGEERIKILEKDGKG